MHTAGDGHSSGPGSGFSVSLTVGDGTSDSEVATRSPTSGCPGRRRSPAPSASRSSTTGRPCGTIWSTTPRSCTPSWSARTLRSSAPPPRPGRRRGLVGGHQPPRARVLPADRRVRGSHEGARGDHVMLGTTARLPGDWQPARPDLAATGDGGTVTVTVDDDVRVGPDERLTLTVRDSLERPVELGSYLGAAAHVAGFHVGTGSSGPVPPCCSPRCASRASCTPSPSGPECSPGQGQGLGQGTSNRTIATGLSVLLRRRLICTSQVPPLGISTSAADVPVAMPGRHPAPARRAGRLHRRLGDVGPGRGGQGLTPGVEELDPVRRQRDRLAEVKTACSGPRAVRRLRQGSVLGKVAWADAGAAVRMTSMAARSSPRRPAVGGVGSRRPAGSMRRSVPEPATARG